jgi:hypothetical protein
MLMKAFCSTMTVDPPQSGQRVEHLIISESQMGRFRRGFELIISVMFQFSVNQLRWEIFPYEKLEK